MPHTFNCLLVSIALFFAAIAQTAEPTQLTPVPKYGPADKPLARPISSDHKYLSSDQAVKSDFWALMPFYVPQFNEYSCSTASVSIVLNGLTRAGGNLDETVANVTQADLIEKVKTAHWKELVSASGYKGRHGLTLAQLEEVTQESLKAFGAKDGLTQKNEVTAATPNDLMKFRSTLKRNENNPANFLMVHFVQDDLTKAKGGPYAHICPVGAYDEKTNRVLILDVDRTWYEPYWIADEELLKAMAHKTDAFGFGGYILVSGVR